MSAEAMTIRHVIVHGRVQGVGYRAWAEYAALKKGLEGWVRNRRDGTVEALFAGPAEVVAAMVDACRRGPPGARINSLFESEAGEEMLGQRRPGELFSVLGTV
jgi:acylphosphatase